MIFRNVYEFYENPRARTARALCAGFLPIKSTVLDLYLLNLVLQSLEPGRFSHLYLQAVTSLRSGDVDAFRMVRHEMLERFAGSDDPGHRLLNAQLCVLISVEGREILFPICPAVPHAWGRRGDRAFMQTDGRTRGNDSDPRS